MEIQAIAFTGVEFEGADGVVHFIRDCSLAGREELRTRLKQLGDRLATAGDEATVRDLYDGDTMFRWRVNRALELCGIQPDWVSIDQMVALLFAHPDGESIRPGWLVQLNFPQSQQRESDASEAEGQTYADLVATLSTYFESLNEAIDRAKNHPASELLDIIKAKAAILEQQRRASDPKYAQKQDVKEKQRRAKDRWRELRERQQRGQQKS